MPRVGSLVVVRWFRTCPHLTRFHSCILRATLALYVTIGKTHTQHTRCFVVWVGFEFSLFVKMKPTFNSCPCLSGAEPVHSSRRMFSLRRRFTVIDMYDMSYVVMLRV